MRTLKLQSLFFTILLLSISFAQENVPTFEWVRTFDEVGHVQGRRLAIGPEDQIGITGFFRDSIMISNDEAYESPGEELNDAFVVEYSPDGAQNTLYNPIGLIGVWPDQNPGGSNESWGYGDDLGYGAAYDVNGVLLTCGWTFRHDTSEPPEQDFDLFYSNGGSPVIWNYDDVDFLDEYAYAIDVHPVTNYRFIAGKIYLEGSDIGLYFFDENGGLLTWYSLGDDYGDTSIPYDIKITESGAHFYLTGWFDGALSFGGDMSASSGGDFDMFVVKYDIVTALPEWFMIGTGNDSQKSMSMDVDSDDNVVVTGSFTNQITIGNTTITDSSLNMFVAKFDAEGTLAWLKTSETGGSDDENHSNGAGVAMDDYGNVIVAGSISGTVMFDDVSVTSNGYRDIMVASYDASDGSLNWVETAGGPCEDKAWDVGILSDGSPVITGTFSDIANFGEYTVFGEACDYSDTNGDFFAAKISIDEEDLNPGEISFNLTGFEGGPATGDWMFDVDMTPFDFNGDETSIYAYSGYQWNADGHGDGSCEAGDPNPGSGVISSSVATDENLNILNSLDGVTIVIDGFTLTHFEHINTENSGNTWDTMGEAGDYRIYSNGIGEIRVDGTVKIRVESIVLYSTTYYPSPVGNGGQTGYATVAGEGTIDVALSDPAWVAEMDPNNTGMIAFESNSMSPTVQLCYGAYNADLLVTPMAGPPVNDTWHVSTAGSDDTGDGSEGNPFATIQAGIDAASDGDTVLVADGTYTGTGNKELTWIGWENHIVVMSVNGPDNCIIDLEDSGRAFTFISGIVDPIWITADDVIEGFTIRNGHPPNWGNGGAIYCYYGYLNDVSPTIRNCVFENNTADLGGVLYVSGGSSLVEDCVFENNSALNGGAVWTGNAGGSTNLVFSNCTFKNNSATSNGGGAFTISNIYPEGTDASPGFKIENCIFDGNSGPYGGAINFYTSTLDVEGCLFINNSASTNGNALYVYNYGGPVIKNCTIADNTGPEAVYCYGFNGTVEPVFVNTIILDENSAFGFENTDQANPIISYCDIQGGFPITGTDGGGNIDSDPFFCEPDNGDYTLAENSPCVGTGQDGANMGALEVGCGPLTPEESHFSFNYAGSITGTFSVSDDLNPMIIPSDGVVTDQGEIDGITYSTFSGVEAVSIDSINLGVVLLQQAGELVLGDYPVDPVTNSAMFGFALGATVTEFPDDIEDLEADAAYLSVSGTITISEITETTISGMFSGTMLHWLDPTDMISVTDGEFTVNTETIFQPYLEGDYSFDYFQPPITYGNYSVSGVIDPLNLPTEGAAGFYGFISDTSTLIITGVETFVVDEADSINIGAIIINKPGELGPGTYDVDPISQTVLFGFALGAEFTTIPEDIEDLIADKVYISGMGSITISELTDGLLSGSFSGTIFNPLNPMDYLYVTNGSFSLNQGEILQIDGSYPDRPLPSDFVLEQNFPNPFNPVTTLRYDLPVDNYVTLIIYDLNGKEINRLVNTSHPAGHHSVMWNSTDSFDKPVSAGIYLYQIRTAGFVQTRKMVLLK